MIRSLFIPLVFLFLGLFMSCKKEVVDDSIFLANDTTLTIGDSLKHGIHFNTIDPVFEVISPWHSGTTGEFDLEDDGINDLYFTSSFSVSPGGLNARGCSIGSLRPQVEIAMFNRIDSIVGWTTITPGGTAYQSQNYIAGTPYPSNADTSQYQYNCLTKYSFGIQLNRFDSSWSADTVLLTSSNNSSYLGLPSSVQLGSWQSDSRGYAAIKITKGSKTVLGWIEMNVANYYEIRLYKKAYMEF